MLSYSSHPTTSSLNDASASGIPFSAKAHRDFALVTRILSHHDERAYAELVQVYQKPIYQLVVRMVPQRDVAEDLTLEVFMRAFRFLPTFKPVFAFSTWLFRLASNYCRSFLQRRRLRVVSLQAVLNDDEQGEFRFAELPNGEPTPYDLLIQTQRHERLHQAVAALPRKYGILLQLYFFDELSYEEIAGRCHLPLGTVKAQLHRGRELLRQVLVRELATL